MLLRRAFLTLALTWLLAAALPAAVPPSQPRYDFTVERGSLEMPDGVALAVTFFQPVARRQDERFPVLLELLPYRKDDSFYLRDYPLYAYFARRGYVGARVDVRGTGSSEGTLPPREYSEIELRDAEEVLRQLAAAPFSSGKVGMWGISWSGFNALQVAMRRPPELAAILVLHASDDLFHDDVHYIDGSLHVDSYALEINHENALPAPPEYRLDEAFFRHRFDREPWIFTYLRQQQDGDFWRRGSQRFHPEAVQVPVAAIGGLLDGYRDTVPRLLESLGGPATGVIGPWNHSWPDNGVPGPVYEWRREAVRWWDRWLKGRDTGVTEEPRLHVFVRAGHAPGRDLEQTPGDWRSEEWPIARARPRRWFPDGDHGLAERPGEPAVERLAYLPSSGVATGNWWGEPTGDLRPDGAGSLVFESPPLVEAIEIVGFPRVKLRSSVSVPLARWAVRLEDVQPDGAVSLVTGATLNGAQRDDRLAPRPLVPGQAYDLELTLHFTTWTFRPGHRLRLAVSNALFPMVWPTPEPMEMTLHLGEASWLELPEVPFAERPRPPFLPPEPREERADARHLPGGGSPQSDTVTRDLLHGKTTVEQRSSYAYEIGERRFTVSQRQAWSTSDRVPARSGFLGEATHTIELEGRVLELRTRIEIRSDAESFHVTVSREIAENGEPRRRRDWRQAIPRRLQ